MPVRSLCRPVISVLVVALNVMAVGFMTVELNAQARRRSSFGSGGCAYYPFVRNGLTGFIDSSGAIALDPVYRVDYERRAIEKDGRVIPLVVFPPGIGFRQGRAAVTVEEKFWFLTVNSTKVLIDCDGRQKELADYSMVDAFSEGYAVYMRFRDGIVGRNSGRYGLLDLSGEQVLETDYDLVVGFSDSRALVERNGHFGFIDKDGKEVIPCNLFEASSFSEGRASVRRVSHFGYIDTNGRSVTDFLYSFAGPFTNGFAKVMDPGSDKYYFIDQGGKRVWDQAFEYAYSFSEGYACVKRENDFLYLDQRGQKAFRATFADARPFRSGLAAVMGDNNLWGFIDTNGEFVIEPRFDYVGDFDGALAVASINDSLIYIDRRGKEVFKVFETREMRTEWNAFIKKR